MPSCPATPAKRGLTADSETVFSCLLHQLGSEHDREVRGLQVENSGLQAENSRLKRMCSQVVSSQSLAGRCTPMLAASSGEDPAVLAVTPCSRPHITALDFKALTTRSSDSAGKPDEEALQSAFAVSTVIELTNDFEDETPRNGYSGRWPAPPMYNAPADAEDQRTASPLPSQQGTHHHFQVDLAHMKWQDPDMALLREDLALAPTDVASESTVSRPGKRGVDLSEAHRLSLSSRDPAGRVSQLNQPMQGWRVLIEQAKTTQNAERLPKIHQFWREVVDEDGQNQENVESGFTGLLNVVTKAAKEANRTASFMDDRTSGRSTLPARFSTVSQSQYKDWFIVLLMQPCMLHPTCRRRIIWDFAGILLLLHDLIFIPMQAFKELEDFPALYSKNPSVLDLSGAIFWTLDIGVSFLTGYYSAEGYVELYPPRIARHYMRGWFPLDLLIVATDWLTLILGGMSSASGFLRLGKTVSRILRVLRLLRFMKMNKLFQEMIERINSEYVLQLVSLCKILLIVVVMNHYVACIWYAIGSLSSLTSRWPDKFLVNYPQRFLYAYTTAMHWSLTQFTPASMEVVPQNEVERAYTILVIIMALVAFSSFVSSITAAMTHIRQIKTKQLEMEAKIRQFFSEHRISQGMASRVWRFLRKNKGLSSRRLRECDVPALNSLPQKLREDLRLEIFLPILSCHPFFEMYHKREGSAVLRLCNEAFTEKAMMIGEELFANYDKCIKSMFFVLAGTLHYMDQSTLELSTDIPVQCDVEPFLVKRGQWACEAALWASEAKLSGPFVSVGGPSEVILIDTYVFFDVAKANGGSIAFVTKYAETFMEHFIEANKKALMEEDVSVRKSCEFTSVSDDGVNVLFNDTQQLNEMVTYVEEELPRKTLASMVQVPKPAASAGFIGSNLGIGTAMSQLTGVLTRGNTLRETADGKALSGAM